MFEDIVALEPQPATAPVRAVRATRTPPHPDREQLGWFSESPQTIEVGTQFWTRVQAWVASGLMVEQGSDPARAGHSLFTLTDAGRAAVRLPPR
jgi:hypothetical protein